MKKIILLLISIAFFSANSMGQFKLLDHCVCAKVWGLAMSDSALSDTNNAEWAKYWDCDELAALDLKKVLENCLTAYLNDEDNDPDSIIFVETWSIQSQWDIEAYSQIENHYLSSNCFTSLGCGSTGIAEEGAFQKTVLYPNPAKGNLFIQTAGMVENVWIYDLKGNEVFFEKYDNFAETVSISLEGIAEGTYICRVQSNNGVEVQKIAVVK